MSDTPPVPPEPTPAYVPPAQAYPAQQPPYAQQPYPAQPYTYGQPGYPQPYAAPPRTNVLAIVSLCLTLATFLTGITAIGGVITGHIALSQIKRTGEGGHGLALAGVIVGYVLIGIGIIAIVLYAVFVVLLVGAAGVASTYDQSNS